MIETPCCAYCGTPLTADAPDGAICEPCAEAEAAREQEYAPTVADGPDTPPAPIGSVRTNVSAPPEVVGDYEVLGKLGQGGMGAVYRARQISLDRLVALKILPSQFEEDETYVARFQREASTAASLNHPNLVRVYASGQADGCHFIAMELVEGENLRQHLKRNGPLSPVDALRTCLEVARGLQCGWQKAQLIHRDIKPSNIYISHGGEVKLGDLGLAKSLLSNTTGVTNTGTALGTPHYISPEQARGEKSIDHRADIYSLGCTLYEIIVGSTPYTGTDPLAIITMHLTAPPPAIMKVLPDCPVPAGRVVNKMVRKAKHERHQSYEELIVAMESAIEQIENPVTSGPSAIVEAWKEIGAAEQGYGTLRRAEKSGEPKSATRRFPTGPALPIGIAAGVVLLAGGAFIAFWPTHEKETAAQAVLRATNAAKAAATPGPESIKLWDTPEKLGSDPHAQIKGGVLELTKQLVDSNVQGRDGVIRGDVRMNHDSNYTRIGLRATVDADNRQTAYLLNLHPGDRSVRILVAANGNVKELRRWDVLRDYADDEWATAELRAVGDELTASVDGKVVGSVHDSTLTLAGGAFVSASSNGYFRDLSFTPLDGEPANAPASPAPARASNEITLWDTQEKIHSRQNAAIEAGVLKIIDGGLVLSEPPRQNAVLRASLRLDRDARQEGIGLRRSGNSATGQDADYRAEIDRRSNPPSLFVTLKAVVERSEKTLQTWTLPEDYGKEGWVRIEFHVVGNALTVTLDGQVLGTIHDSSVSAPGVPIVYGRPGYFRDITYTPLDGAKLAKAGTDVAPQKSTTVEGFGETRRLIPTTPDSAKVGEVRDNSMSKTSSNGASAVTSKPWQDALAEPPLKDVIARLSHSEQGYALPSGNHWAFPAHLMGDCAFRLRAVAPESPDTQPPKITLVTGGELSQYRLTFPRSTGQCLLVYGRASSPAQTLAVVPNVKLVSGIVYEVVFARVSDSISIILNGKEIVKTNALDVTPGRFSLDISKDADAQVLKAEYLDLTGMQAAEALRSLGIDPAQGATSSAQTP